MARRLSAPATKRSGNTGLSTLSISTPWSGWSCRSRDICAQALRARPCGAGNARTTSPRRHSASPMAPPSSPMSPRCCAPCVRSAEQGFAYMSADCPMCSLRITDEELLIVRLLRAARSRRSPEGRPARSRACAEKCRSPHCRCSACARQPAHRVCCRLRAAGTSLRAAGRDRKRAGRQQWGLSFPVSGRRSRRSAPSMNDLATVLARSRQEDDIISRASSGRPLRSPSRPPRHRLRPSVRR